MMLLRGMTVPAIVARALMGRPPAPGRRRCPADSALRFRAQIAFQFEELST